MPQKVLSALLPLVVISACARTAPTAAEAPAAVALRTSEAAAADVDVAPPQASAVPEATSVTQLDADGNDDPVDPLPGPIPVHLLFERVGRPPMALQRIPD